MKRFVRRVQQLGEQAVKVREVLDAAPGKAEQIRQTVLTTAAQVQQLRAEVLGAVTGLRSLNEGRLVDSIAELDLAAPVLAEAGYGLGRVELEMGVTQRLIVDLVRVEEVPAARIRGLAEMHKGSGVLHSLLMSVITAQELAAGVDSGSFRFAGLTAYVGAAPCVRLAWEPWDAEESGSGAEVEVTRARPPVMASAPPVAPSPVPPSPVSAPQTGSAFASYGESSFFQPRAKEAAAPKAPSTPPPAPVPEAVPAGDARVPAVEAVAADPLARFKKMPDLSKRSGTGRRV